MIAQSARFGFTALTAAALIGADVWRRRRALRRDAATLRDRVVIITGGGRGLGYMLARALAGAGARVTIAGRSMPTLERARSRLQAEGIAVEIASCDVRDPDDASALVEQVIERDGVVDVLVNNAGVIEVGSVWDQSLADFHESVDTHVFGALHTMRAVLPAMRARGAGQIVNIASVGGLVAPPHLAPYAAGKFGLVGLSQAYAAEVSRDGITVTTVCPGLMRTGSADGATFKGRTRAEYTWFALADSAPVLSTSVDRAVATIVRAIVRRRRFVTITAPARAAHLAAALVPNLTASVLALAGRALPAPLDDPPVRASGAASHSAFAPSALTILDRAAKRRTNEER